jgi:S1-C subfamily serine protease
MFSSAVKVTALVLATNGQGGQLTPRDQQLWRELEPSFVTLLSNGRPVGAAALIDEQGLFLANRNAVLGNTVEGRLADGRVVRLHLKAEDRTTLLVLLEAEKFRMEGAVPFRLPGEATPGPVFAVVDRGPIRAELVSSNRMGIVGKNRRMIPLGEVRFEGSPAQFDNAIFVQGRMVLGTMVSVLEKPMGRQEPPAGIQNFAPRTLPFSRNFGPEPMTVAYMTGPDVVRRVIDGFLSPAREVAHPYLGVICRDAVDTGAQVVRVAEGSGAAKAGIRVGDIILSIGNARISDQMDFAQVMFRQRVGSKIPIMLRRGNATVVAEAIVGKAAE